MRILFNPQRFGVMDIVFFILLPVIVGFDDLVQAQGPVEECSWSAPECGGIIMTPLVVQLTDDNGEGRIGALDLPDIPFTLHRKSLFPSILFSHIFPARQGK